VALVRAVLAVLALLVLAAPAEAATVSRAVIPYVEPPGTPLEESCSRYAACPPGTVRVDVRALPAETNEVTIAVETPSVVVVRDTSAPLVAGTGCAARPDGSVACAPPSSEGWWLAADVVLGDGDDTVVSRGVATHASGGHGNDILRGGPGVDALHGGPGDDLLIGAGGPDRLFGGAGRDTLRGGRGADHLSARDGGPDLVYGGPGTDRARVESADTLRSVERVDR
jgi:hypothetical protein